MSKPTLAGFTAATAELCAVAQRARAGEPIEEVTVSREPTARIPTREMADAILAIVSRAPGLQGHEDKTTKRTIAVMHANLLHAVVHAIFVDYPDLMRADRAGDSTAR
jgi:hypothetical protein